MPPPVRKPKARQYGGIDVSGTHDLLAISLGIGTFEIHFQSIANLRSRRTIGYEAVLIKIDRSITHGVATDRCRHSLLRTSAAARDNNAFFRTAR